MVQSLLNPMSTTVSAAPKPTFCGKAAATCGQNGHTAPFPCCVLCCWVLPKLHRAGTEVPTLTRWRSLSTEQKWWCLGLQTRSSAAPLSHQQCRTQWAPLYLCQQMHRQTLLRDHKFGSWPLEFFCTSPGMSRSWPKHTATAATRTQCHHQ